MSGCVLLLGAGSSIPGGFPSTPDLTHRVASGAGVRFHTSDAYNLGPINDEGPSGHVLLITRFVCRLKAVVDRYFAGRPRHSTTYEDIYYLASQIADSESGELDNPGLFPLIQEMRSEFDVLIREFDVPRIRSFSQVATQTVHYLHDVVWCSLSRKPSSTEHLVPLLRLCQSQQFDRIGIATLSHDTHVEDFLLSEGANLVDGFSAPENGVRYWERTLLLQETAAPLFLKLHGSVNWFRFRPVSGIEWYNDRVGIPVDGDCVHSIDNEGTLQDSLDCRPQVLIGTFNKISSYTRHLFFDLHYQFRAFLDSVDRVAVCGYGFGDKGINEALLEWFYGRRERQVFVFHRHPDELVQTARGAIADKWERWLKSGRVKVIEKWIEELEHDELIETLAA